MPPRRHRREALPEFLAPMLCVAGDARDAPAGRRVELKHDGLRAQVRVAHGAVTLRSRPGHDRTARFPELQALAAPLAGREVLLDGELVVHDDRGRPDFAAVRRRLVGGGRPQDRAACLVAFDVLHLDGEPVRERPLAERLAVLAALLPARGPAWCLAEALEGPVEDVLRVVAAHELEGVVVKDPGAPWRPGARSRAWVKHKLRRREELEVSAVRPGGPGRPDALLVRRADGRPAGEVRFGLDPDARAALREAVARRAAGPARGGLVRVARGVTVVVDAHGTADGPLRDPVLRGWSEHP